MNEWRLMCCCLFKGECWEMGRGRKARKLNRPAGNWILRGHEQSGREKWQGRPLTPHPASAYSLNRHIALIMVIMIVSVQYCLAQFIIHPDPLSCQPPSLTRQTYGRLGHRQLKSNNTLSASTRRSFSSSTVCNADYGFIGVSLLSLSFFPYLLI